MFSSENNNIEDDNRDSDKRGSLIEKMDNEVDDDNNLLNQQLANEEFW